MSDLVKRARAYVVHVDGKPINLGDRIEELEVEVAKLKRDLQTANYTIGLNIKARAAVKGETP